MRKKAEKIEAEAKESTNTKFVACGLAYQDIYNRNPEGTDNDEVLYNAGVCFEDGKSIGASILMFNLLEKYYRNPRSPRRRSRGSARRTATSAFYDKASDKLEQYARRTRARGRVRRDERRGVLRKGIGDDDLRSRDSFSARSRRPHAGRRRLLAGDYCR